MIIAYSARPIPAADLNDSFIGRPLAIEVDGLAHYVRLDGIQERPNGIVRLFVGVPVGPAGETWLDLPRMHDTYYDQNNDRAN
ncbi:hypothetical protein [Xylanimonas protaetiae]|uniref:Uncharacterized protein n=1 Tax=Xylanimonas protaetiae TaxID=2509457 RepID=A0A4P6F5G3_9MICO|nr:hypothetical protein [Xylanimonas protaetiae]QAY70003.1 hypothetical protein ET471_08135 [Xylanimonas protaetiae]